MKNNRIANILLREFLVYYLDRLFSILPNHGVTCSIRGASVSPFFHKCGKSFKLAQSSIINYPEKMIIGNNVYFAHRIYVNACCELVIGDNVTIGPNCIIASANHAVKNGVVLNEGTGGKIIIKSGTWIGGNSTITGGVTIGRNCIIGAGSVVTKDIPDGVMAAGVPAKVIKELDTGGSK